MKYAIPIVFIICYNLSVSIEEVIYMTNKLESVIVKLLLNFGISPNTKGYHYLRDCIFI